METDNCDLGSDDDGSWAYRDGERMVQRGACLTDRGCVHELVAPTEQSQCTQPSPATASPIATASPSSPTPNDATLPVTPCSSMDQGGNDVKNACETCKPFFNSNPWHQFSKLFRTHWTALSDSPYLYKVFL